MQKIEIENRTAYSTRHLRSIIIAACNYIGLRKEQKARLHFIIKNTPEAAVKIRHQGGARFNLYLPKNMDKRDFAHIIVWACGVYMGKGNRDMKSIVWKKEGMTWVDEYSLEHKSEKKLTRDEKIGRAIWNIQKRLHEKERALKRLQNAIKKLTKQEKYYQKQMHAPKKQNKEPNRIKLLSRGKCATLRYEIDGFVVLVSRTSPVRAKPEKPDVFFVCGDQREHEMVCLTLAEWKEKMGAYKLVDFS